MEKLKVLLAASEVVPFAKTGGLADVAGSLPLELKKLGIDVRVIMPKYASVKVKADETVMGDGVKVYFVRNDKYFKRKNLYGDKFGDYHDNLDRFAFFSRQALERTKREKFKPDIIHCNEWQTALIPAYLNTIYKKDKFFAKTKTLLTIHNMAYQGLFDKEEYPRIGLDWDFFSIDHFEFYDKVNVLKAAISWADAINTVSPTYAREILTEEYGCGLEGALKTREGALYGILNGIDYGVWDPGTDKKLFKNYSVDKMEDRYANKEGLQEEVGFKVDRDIPMVGVISRLADQKGMDLLAMIINDLLNLKVQFILLGTGEHKYHVLLQKIAKAYQKNTSINLRFDAILAQRIYAAADIFLIPSKYEPCGLSQMISFRYGAIPVVRSTGGLKDSVEEFDPKTRRGTGFTFERYRSEDLLGAIKKALVVYKNRDMWRALVKTAMGLDFSWRTSAGEYAKLYNKILKAR